MVALSLFRGKEGGGEGPPIYKSEVDIIWIVVFSLKLFGLQFTYLWDPGVSLWDLQVPIVPLRTRSIRNAAKHPVA